MTTGDTRAARGEGRRRARRRIGLTLAILPLFAPRPSLVAQAPTTTFESAVSAALDSGIVRTADLATLPARLQDGIRDLAEYVRTGSRAAVDRALFRFDQEAAGRDAAWPHYLSARAFLLLLQRQAPVINAEGKREGEDHQEAMWSQLDRALAADSGFPPARRLAMHLLERAGDRDLRDVTRRVLERELRRPDALADALRAGARAARSAGDDSLALTLLREAERRGTDRGVVALERARTLAALGDSMAAGTTYWDGARQASPATLELYRADLAWILDADSLASFDRATRRGGVQGWLERFWASRDAALGIPPGARLREHLRRWAVAMRDYRVPQPWSKTRYTRFWYVAGGTDCIKSATAFVDSLPVHPPVLDGDIRQYEPLLDHRGFTYLHHGEPVVRLTPPDAEGKTVLREIWIYWLEGHWRVISFGGSGGSADDTGAFGMHAATTMMSYLPLDAGAYEALARVLPEYRKVASQLLMPATFVAPGCRDQVKEAVEKQRRDTQLAWHTDSDSPHITAPWNAEVRSFALGTAQHRDGRALVTFAIPVSDVPGDTLADGRVLWQPRFHIVAFRPSDGARITLDALRRFLGAPPESEDAKLTDWFELPLGPGTWELSVRVGAAGGPGGADALARNLVVNRGDALALSDIVTGREGHPGWPTPDGPFPVNALGTWRVGETVELYYEVSGLDPGEDYHTTLEVVPLSNPGRERPVTVGTSDRATGSVTRVRKAIGLARLRGGVYRLIVTIEARGTTVRREQEILVLK